jgi:hypothetical protein
MGVPFCRGYARAWLFQSGTVTAHFPDPWSELQRSRGSYKMSKARVFIQYQEDELKVSRCKDMNNVISFSYF